MKKTEFIMLDILSKIYQKQFPGGKLPDQRTLAKLYHVSRYTIQASIKSLSEIGAISVVQGSGMYISDHILKNPLIFNSLTRTPYDRVSSKLISLRQEMATSEDEQIFQLKQSAMIWVFERIRIVDYQIEQIEYSRMPVYLFPDLTKDHVQNSIQKYVQQKGYSISHYITSYTPTIVSKQQADLLQCKKGTPAMKISNRCLLEDGRVYEVSSLISINYTCTYFTPFNKKRHEARQRKRS